MLIWQITIKRKTLFPNREHFILRQEAPTSTASSIISIALKELTSHHSGVFNGGAGIDFKTGAVVTTVAALVEVLFAVLAANL